VKKLHLMGYCCSLGGVEETTAQGPLVIAESVDFEQVVQGSAAVAWDAFLTPPPHKDNVAAIADICQRLGQTVSALVKQGDKFVVVGGDHTCAMGTWSGAYDALHQAGDIGLIWIDAHMDSHVLETSYSGRVHGMCLAALLGHGDPAFTSLFGSDPKLKPENVCLIGVRSYEPEEAELLKKLNVRVYFIDEVKNRGFAVVLREAIAKVSEQTVGYGLSLDLDAIDPADAPGVDVPAENGLSGLEVYRGLVHAATDPKLIGTEVVEFNPVKDKNRLTEKLAIVFLKALSG
jgi:arginase